MYGNDSAREGTTIHLARAKALRADCAPEKVTSAIQAEPAGEAFELCLVGSAADDQGPSGKHSLMRGERLEQHIDALQISELADEHEIHRVVSQHRLVEFVAVKPVRNDASGTARLADQLDIAIGGKHAFEQKPVGQRQQPALGHDVEPAHGI